MFRPVDPNPNFNKLEEEILKFWEREKIFEKSLEQTRSGQPFVFYEGPPTANAAPGIHHVEARSFKDLIPRYQTMRGRFVARKSGWDTHGLPVELQIEKKLGISGKKQIESLKSTVRESIAYFNQLCKESVWQFKEDWEKLTRRMGFWIDLDHPYITYENSYIEKVWGVLKTVWDKGLLYQGHKVVPYCPRCGTALSSHEVAQGYERVTENSVYVKFRLKKPINGRATSILSWTTTPWTLPGNLGLAVGEGVDYVTVEKDGENYIVAKETVAEVFRPPSGNLKVSATLKGSQIVGLEYEPLFDIPALKSDKSYHINAANFVNTEEGTGIVHTAVMYGEDDYELGTTAGLPKHHTVDEEGKFTEDLSVYGLAGLPVKSPQAESQIIDYLKSKNLLLKEEPYEHDYPFCWRCGTALLYYARNSWFIKMSALREELIKNNRTINWVPEHIKEGRFGEWLREVKDWAISRERYWGTPLPIWECGKCGKDTVVGSIEELKNRVVSSKQVSSKLGEDGNLQLTTYNFTTFDLHRPYIDEVVLKCAHCGGEASRVPEVLDVWFDSGSMPFAQGMDQFPADFIVEAVDQTRGWFYTLLAISTLVGRGPSYRNVICLGLVLDEKGEKMSKSKGNIVNPMEVGAKYGFDIIRWYFYSVNQPGDNKLFAESELVRLQRRLQKILWNVYNYFVTYANAAGWSYDVKQSPSDTKNSANILDQWQNARLQQLIKSVSESLDNFDAFRATRDIEGFIDDLSTWYLRRSRGRQDQAFFSTLYRNLIYLSKLLAPFMPFLAEIIYGNLKVSVTSAGDVAEGFSPPESVHLDKWPEAKIEEIDGVLLSQMREVRGIVEQVHALRAKAGIKLRQPLLKLTIPEPINGLTTTKTGKGSQGWEPINGLTTKTGKGSQPIHRLFEILKEEINVKEIVVGEKLELDTAVTPELKQEGLVRELTRVIQGLRKEKGLKIGQPAAVEFETTSEDINRAMEQIDKKKVYVTETFRSPDGGLKTSATGGKEMEVDGEKIKLQITSTKFQTNTNDQNSKTQTI